MATNPLEAMATPEEGIPEDIDPDMFAEVKAPGEVEGTMFDDVALPGEETRSHTPALRSKTLIAALASIDPNKDAELQFGQGLIDSARELLEQGKERQLRYQLAGQRTEREMAGLAKLSKGLGPLADPTDVKAVEDAYGNVLRHTYEERARRSMEDEAVERIQDMAARGDGVAARVLLDNLDKGDANKTIRDFWVRQAKLAQVAEELDEEYQQSGWGRAIFNFVANLIPLNYNAQRSGIVEPSNTGFWDFFSSGENLRKQGEVLTNMPMDEFMDYIDSGDFKRDIKDNATTIFDMTSDPAAAVAIVDALTAQSDSDRRWANAWGIVEPLTLIPVTPIFRTTRAILGAGASKQAIANLDNAVRVLDTEGPEAMAKATGVTSDELSEELSVSAIRPHGDTRVPLSEQVATREQAAREALDEILSPPNGQRFNSTEELKAAFDSKVDEITAAIGRPIKNVEFKVDNLAGGGNVHYVEITFGKKNGHGYAKASTAENAAASMGIKGTPLEVVTTTTRVVDPKEGYTLKVYHATGNDIQGPLRASETGLLGRGLYASRDPEYVGRHYSGMDTGSTNAQVRPLLVREDRVFGADKDVWTVDDMADGLDELGIDRAEFAAWRTDGGSRQLADALDEGMESEQFFNLVTNYFRLNKFASRGSAQAELRAIEHINEQLARRGWEGRAQKVAGQDEVLIFDPANAISTFEPAQVFRDMSGQYFVKARFDIPETGFYTNPLHPPAQGFMSRLFGRWVRSTGRISDPDLHGRAVTAGSLLNRAHKIIEKNIISQFKSLNAQSRQVVEQVALKGANESKWWTPQEFDYLVSRGYGRPATVAEKEAYANLQKFNDMDWVLRNDLIYMEKVQKGQETVKFTTPWGRDIEMDAKINYAPDRVPTDRVYNMSDGVHYTKQSNPLSAKELDRLRNNGYVMVDVVDDAFDIPFGTRNIKVNHILVKRSDLEISNLRRNQLAYSAGGHRMYTDKYFVKQGRKGNQGDTGTEYLMSPNTFITAPNKAEAAKWASTMDRARILVKENKASAQSLDDDVFRGNVAFPSGEEFLRGIDEGTIDLDNPFEAVFDREMPTMYQKSGEDITRLFNEDELGINGYYRTTGRMYTSAKGAHLKDYTGQLAATVDPYEALATSLRQVTRQAGLYHYKTEALERFKNTYGQYLDIQPNHRSNAQILTEAKTRPDIPVELRNQIESQREAILNVVRFETPAEKMREAMYRSTAEWVLGNGDPGFARKFAHDAVWWWKESNPVASMRGLAFDAKLGMFNIGQLFIQASTMVSATALSPKYGMRGMMGLYPMFHYLIKQGSENSLDVMVKRGTWKSMGFNSADEFKDYARHLQQSGFTDMNGSHIMVNDYGPNAHFGSFGDKVDHFRETGRVFFYTPETFNRLVAYRIAWGETMDAGLRVGDPKFNSTVMRLADDYSMNMTSESAAFWQKGLLSIPTQFWAYNIRMMDAMFGKRFTRAQRTRLILANAGMAGAAGVPGLSALSTYLKQQNGEAPDISTLEGAADRGLIDYLIYQTTGADILAGERVGTGTWVTDTVKALFGYSEFGEKSFMDLIGGATYSIGKSTAGAIYDVGKYAVAESGADMGDAGLTSDAFMKLLAEVSTFGNVTKAMMVHEYGIYKSKKGTILADDLPEADAVWVALSFRPEKTDEVGYKLKYLENKKETIREVATQLRNWRQEAFNNPDKFEENMKKANVLIKMLPAADRADVIRQTNAITDDSFYDYLEKKVSEEKLKEGTSE